MSDVKCIAQKHDTSSGVIDGGSQCNMINNVLLGLFRLLFRPLLRQAVVALSVVLVDLGDRWH